MFIGYSEDSSGYILYNTADNTFLISRDVRFNEEEFPFRELSRSDPLYDFKIEDPSDELYIPDETSNEITVHPSSREQQVEESELGQLSNHTRHVTSNNSNTATQQRSNSHSDLAQDTAGGPSVSDAVQNQPRSPTDNSEPRRSTRARRPRDLGFSIDSVIWQ